MRMIDFNRLAVAVCVVACAGLFGCSSDDEGGLRVLSIQCAGANIATNNVALDCDGQQSRDVMRIRAAIGGPTSATDIEGFNFSVVFDPTRFSYVAGSAAVETSFLTLGDGDCDTSKGLCIAGKVNSTICANPQECNVLGVEVPDLTATVAMNDPGRLVLTIHSNSATGVQALVFDNLILKFSIRANNVVVETDPTTLTFENATMVDEMDMPIGIIFRDQIILSVR